MIEKVGYSKPITTARSARGTSSTSSADGAAFASALSAAEGTGSAPAASSIAAMSGANSLYGLQEVNEEEIHRRKAVKRGRLTLEALDKLRDALLMGELPYATLRGLEKLVNEERQLVTDPRLTAILDDIELRAAVEMAKLEMAGLLPPTS